MLDAYGWADIPTDCVFLLDWEDEDEDNIPVVVSYSSSRRLGG